ncbi:hypothetical protein Tco_1279474, partial [Tanacetum coccineum]
TPNTHSDGQTALQSSGGVCTTANNDGRQTSDPQRKHLINTMYSNASNVPPLEYALLGTCTYKWRHCGAIFWEIEKIINARHMTHGCPPGSTDVWCRCRLKATCRDYRFP